MSLRGFLPATIVAATVIGSVVSLIETIHIDEIAGEPTFCLAPMSLCNPAAAATFRTRRVYRWCR